MHLVFSRQIIKIFIWFLIIAIVVGFPASMFCLNFYLKLSTQITLGTTLFYPFMGALLLTVISFSTVAFLIVRLLKENPVDALRN